jgi:antitoxin component of MazEF toxin-antitoxin module
MKSTIIQIGNSKGIRIPKDALILSGINKDIEIKVKKGEIKIVPLKVSKDINGFSSASKESFTKDWMRPEEENAWKIYQ